MESLKIEVIFGFLRFLVTPICQENDEQIQHTRHVIKLSTNSRGEFKFRYYNAEY